MPEDHILSDIIAALALLVSVVAAWAAFRSAKAAENANRAAASQTRIALQTDSLFKLEERFNSRELLGERARAAPALRTNPIGPDIEDVLDFMDTIGLYLKNGALNEDDVWNTFGYWILRYWLLSENYVREKQRKGQSLWDNFASLADKMSKKSAKEGERIDQAELQKFLNEEESFLKTRFRRKP